MLDHLKMYSPYHISNLETLASFLETADIPPPRFDMGTYMSIRYADGIRYVGSFHNVKMHTTPEIYNACGTSACALGHAPLAGIAPLGNENWIHYSVRVFGMGSPPHKNFNTWYFLFGPEWENENNTALAAAARIRWFLKNGAEGWEFLESPWLETIKAGAISA